MGYGLFEFKPCEGKSSYLVKDSLEKRLGNLEFLEAKAHLSTITFVFHRLLEKAATKFENFFVGV